MKARISGLGQWLPERVRKNQEWPAEFAERVKLSDRRELVDISLADYSAEDRIAMEHFAREQHDPFLGSTERRVAEPGTEAPAVEALAATAALKDAGVAAKDLDLILSWAAVPDRIVPPSATRVAHLLGAHKAHAVGMDAACATPLTQLEYATALIESGRARHVLLTQSHLITRAFPMLHPASPSVGDAATAMVVSPSERRGVRTIHAVTEGEYYDAVTWRRQDDDLPWWQAGAAFYLGSLNKAAAQSLVRATVRIGAQTVREAHEKARSLPRMDLLVSVQPRRWIGAAIVEALGLDVPSPTTYDQLAHLGGCGIVTNLMRAREDGSLKEGSELTLYAQGAGFTRAAAVISW